MIDYQQNKLNNRNQKVEIALRYQNHYASLISSLRNLMTKAEDLLKQENGNDALEWQKELRDEVWELSTIKFVAELSFTREIDDINTQIYENVRNLTSYHDAYIVSDTNEARNLFDKSRKFLNGDDLFLSLKKLYKQHTVILQESPSFLNSICRI